MSNIYLNENNIDDLARMLTGLMSEVWIMRDRMAVMEKVMGDKLGLSPKEIDDFIPKPDFAAELEVLRDRFVSNVIGAPLAAKERSVDAILERAQMKRPA
jgi:hypothetical protein